jgi:hypothetical protein
MNELRKRPESDTEEEDDEEMELEILKVTKTKKKGSSINSVERFGAPKPTLNKVPEEEFSPEFMNLVDSLDAKKSSLFYSYTLDSASQGEIQVGFLKDFAILEERADKIKSKDLLNSSIDLDVSPDMSTYSIPEADIIEYCWRTYHYICTLEEPLLPPDHTEALEAAFLSDLQGTV